MKYRAFLPLVIPALLLGACSSPRPTGPSGSATATVSGAQRQAASEKANAFFERVFNESVDRNPERQTALGIKKDYDKWDDNSEAFAQREHDITRQNLQFLRDSIDFAALDDATQLSYRMFEEQAEQSLARFQYRHYSYPVNQMFGMQSGMPAFLINFHKISTEADAQAYIARLNRVPELFRELTKNLERNEQAGAVLPKFLFPKVIDDSRNLIKGKPFDNTAATSPLFEDFQTKVKALEGVPYARKQQLVREASQALTTSVKPAYENLVRFLTEQERRATNEAGVWRFAEGEAFYNSRLKDITTTDFTAEEIHQIGLREVARIQGEMRQIMSQVNFKGSLQEFFTYLQTDPKFYFPDSEAGRQQYLDSTTRVIDHVKTRLDELFLTKPKADMIVKRVEPFREKSAGRAFYTRPAPDGSRPGIYYANLYDMKAMPIYEMEALAYHEGLPGHHMQLAIAQELAGIPSFRRFGGYTAYVEGWGLYCELLPKEIGLYRDPYSDFGRLSMELFRACRLVVDTGIHAKKWNREQGIAYYKQNTPTTEHDIISMVDRHIVMPGQATAYKIGMLKIVELREGAKQKLGNRFDLREFHDVVLTNGAVPLSLLEEMVNQWVEKKQAVGQNQ